MWNRRENLHKINKFVIHYHREHSHSHTKILRKRFDEMWTRNEFNLCDPATDQQYYITLFNKPTLGTKREFFHDRKL